MFRISNTYIYIYILRIFPHRRNYTKLKKKKEEENNVGEPKEKKKVERKAERKNISVRKNEREEAVESEGEGNSVNLFEGV